MMSSLMPSEKYSCSASPLMLLNASTAIEGRSETGCAEAFSSPAGSARVLGPRLGWETDLQRIDSDRLDDILELGRAQIADLEIEPSLHLAISVLRKADGAGLRDAFQTRGDIDAVAHQIAIGFLDNVAKMNADAEFDSTFGRQARIALDHGVLDFDSAAHGVDNAAELDERPVAGALNDAPIVHGDGGIDQIATQRAQPGQGSIFVCAG